MPGYILHLTAGKMLLDMQLTEYKLKGILKDEKEKNAFLAGCLLPDVVRDKQYSHFRNPRYCEEMIEYPDLEMFLEKYRTLLRDSSCLGYYFHLYIDRRFFKDYLPQIISFENGMGRPVTRRGDVEWVCMKRDGRRIRKEEFFSEKYYYGDYTKMNTYLVKRYNLPMDLKTELENPGIKEVEYSDLQKVLKELQGYLGVPADKVEEVRVFQVENLLEFLQEAAREFVRTLEFGN